MSTDPTQTDVPHRAGDVDRERVQPLVGGGLAPLLAEADAGTATALLSHLLRVRAYPVALELVDLWWDLHGEDVAFLKMVHRVQGRCGEISAALRTTVRLAQLKAVPWDSVTRLEGRLLELSGRVPVLPGPVDPVVPASATRVLHLVKESRPYLSNGFTSRSHYNFLAEKAAGLDPVVLTEPGFPRSVVGDAAPSEMRLDDIGHYHLDVGSAELAAMPVHRYLQLFADLALERVQAIRPAVIHVSSGRRGYETALVALAVGGRTGIPVVYEVRSFFEANWTDDVLRETQGEVYRSRMRLEEECMQRADFVLTISESMRREIIARGIPAEKVGLVPNGVDVSRFTPSERNPILAAKAGIGDVPTFGYVSNMDHYREGQETLVRATAVLKAGGRPEHCVLVGDGPRREMLEGLARELGVADRVHFTGSVEHDRVVDHYALIDVFVVPRTRERAALYVTPLKPFEAMAMGTPLVVSDLPALIEIADPPRRGWRFTPDDARDLARTLTEVFDDPEERARRVAAATAWVNHERQWIHNGERYRRHFEQVVDASVRR